MRNSGALTVGSSTRRFPFGALLGIPGRANPFSSEPFSDPDGEIRPRSNVRKTLGLSSAEGMLAEGVTAFASGAVLAGWALYLGCGAAAVGMLGALPYLAQWVQLPAAWLGSKVGARKLAIAAVSLSRQALLPLVLMPWLPLSDEHRRLLLYGVATVSALSGVVGNNAWVTWMGELVPQSVRGRYFGRRTALCTFANICATLFAGGLLDLSRTHGMTGYALAGLAGLACLLGAGTTLLMMLQHEPVGMPRSDVHPIIHLRRILREPLTQRVLLFQFAWNGAVGLAASYFVFHMLMSLRMGFTLMALHASAAAAVRMLALPAWGRLVDRLGVRPVMIFCSFGIAFIPLIWLFPTSDFLWPLAVDAIAAGILWGGHNLSIFALPLALGPREGKAFYVATFTTVGGATYAAATFFGGQLLQSLPENLVLLGRPLEGLHVIFMLSAGLRLVAAVLSLSLAEKGRNPLSEVGGAVSMSLRTTAGKTVRGLIRR